MEPFDDNASLNKLLEKKVGFYHIGYLTNEFEIALLELQDAGFYLINTFASEAFSNKQCAFLYTSEMRLVEIIQK